MPIDFDECFSRISESSRREQGVRDRLIESVLELNNVRRINGKKQREFTECEIESNKLREANKEIKMALMRALIERDELMTKKSELSEANERLSNQLYSMEQESNELLRSEQVDHICERYSLETQMSLVNKLQDARRRLIESGFPLHHFA